MKISHVHVRNYRSLKDVEIDLDDYAALVGANGAGKSSLLYALDWFFNGHPLTPNDVSGYQDGVTPSDACSLDVTVTQRNRQTLNGTDLSGKMSADSAEHYAGEGYAIVVIRGVITAVPGKSVGHTSKTAPTPVASGTSSKEGDSGEIVRTVAETVVGAGDVVAAWILADEAEAWAAFSTDATAVWAGVGLGAHFAWDYAYLYAFRAGQLLAAVAEDVGDVFLPPLPGPCTGWTPAMPSQICPTPLS